MKNKYVLVGFALFLTLLIFSSAKAELTTGVEGFKTEGRVGEVLSYKVTFHNLGAEEMYISLFVVAEVEPDAFTLPSGGTQAVYVNYTIPSQTPPGTLFVPVKLFDKNGIEYNYSIILQGQVLEPTYPFSVVRMSEVSSSTTGANTETPFNLNFVLTGVPKNTTAAVNIDAPFELTYRKSLNLVSGRNEVTVPDIIIAANAVPGNQEIKISVSFSDGTVLQKYFTLNVAGYSKCETSSSLSSNFVIKKYTATVSNPGSSAATCSVSTELSSVEKMLLSDVTKGYTFTNEKLSWAIEVPAGKSATIGYTVNYVPVVILPFVIIIIALLFWYFTRKMEIVRELVDYKLYPGYMDLKVQVHVRNLSNQHYRHVRIKEPLGAYVKEVKEFGTAAGQVEVEHKKKIIVWEVEELKPKEERVFNYKIRTSVEVLGQINFAPTVVEYVTLSGERRTDYAPVFSVEVE